MTRSRIILLIALLFAVSTTAKAQRIALSSNLLEDAIATPNIGAEIVMADRLSIALDLSCAPYKLTQQYHNKTLTFRGAYKYWFSQALYANYLGIDAVFSSSDVGLGQTNYRQEYIAFGVEYGYSFILNKRMNLVPAVGIGYAYGNTYEGHDHMISAGNGVEATVITGTRPVVTRLGITLQYVLK